jgi:ribosomal protein S18 acetylase RimI-like enzyme
VLRRVKTQVTTYYLELLSEEAHTPSRTEAPDLEIRQTGIAAAELSRSLYRAVGRDWSWTDRLGWPLSKWWAHLERPEVEVWTASLDGVITGYFELERGSAESVEIAYFGVLPQFTGRGIGGCLLSNAVERGFNTGARRVWLHTCSLDSPRAIDNYQARGFNIFKEETTLEEIPPPPAQEDVS